VTNRIHIFRNGEKCVALDTLTLKKYYFDYSQKDSLDNLDLMPIVEIKKNDAINNIQIAVTTKCNLNCIYCQLYKNRPDKLEDMTIDVAQIIYEKYKPLFSSGTLIVTGGEPFMNWNITSYLLKKSSGRKIVFTNGTFLSEEKIEFLKEYNTFLIVSSDGNRECNDFSRLRKDGVSVSSLIHNNLLLLKELKANFGISLVLNDRNYKNITPICNWLIDEYAPNSLGINLPHYTKDYTWNFPEAELITEFEKLFHLSIDRNIFIDPISRYLSPLIKEEPKLHDCSACGRKVVFYPNGKESNCILKHLFSRGNALDIWKNRSPLNSKICETCFAKGICGGGCIFDGNMFFGEGSFDKRRCGIIKKLVESILWDIPLRTKNISSKLDIIAMYQDVINNPTNKNWSVGHDQI
jgi:radical SAM protein with 4Fe4S-binding SPASM domain